MRAIVMGLLCPTCGAPSPLTNDGENSWDSVDDKHWLAMRAAPELLSALKLAVQVMQDKDIDEALAGEFEVFTDAIAKAEGRDE